MNSQQEAVKIKFPCKDYPLKIMGPSAPDFKEAILQIIKKYDRQHDGTATTRQSRKGNFTSVNVAIYATGADQIKKLYTALKKSGRVTMVL